jgi:formylglycine-generating enzyme required for sulfatase activity
MKTILILESNPNRDLALNQEIRDLENAIDRAHNQDQFSIAIGIAVRPEDLQPLLLKHQPHIIHFCGHGTGETGLVLQDSNNRPTLLGTEALANLFSLCHTLECVILNACYSNAQASALAQHIDFVIGIQEAILDNAARYFSEGFYLALGYGKPIEIAYQWGCNAIQVRLPDTQTPSRKLLAAQLETTPTAPLPEHLKPTLWQKQTLLSSKPTSRSQSYPFTVIQLDRQGKEISNTQHQTTALITQLSETLDLEMVQIPSGIFAMGSNLEKNEQPIHTVTVPEFQIGKYPITQAQWRSIAALPKIQRELIADPSHFKGDQNPVEQISWHDAMEFCHRLSLITDKTYRLPSEAEWEYACRAGTTTPFHCGESLHPTIANYNPGNKLNFLINFIRGSTTAVGQFQVANPFGLYDMHGNVWEWCLDNWHETYLGAPTDATAWTSATSATNAKRHPVRGGSWDFSQTGCRCAFRLQYEADSKNDFLGFRVVCINP